MNKKLLGLVGLVGVGIAAYFLLNRKQPVNSVSSSTPEAATPTIITPVVTTPTIVTTPINTTTVYAPSTIYSPTTTYAPVTITQPSVIGTTAGSTQPAQPTDNNITHAMGTYGQGVLASQGLIPDRSPAASTPQQTTNDAFSSGLQFFSGVTPVWRWD